MSTVILDLRSSAKLVLFESVVGRFRGRRNFKSIWRGGVSSAFWEGDVAEGLVAARSRSCVA